MLRKWIEGIFIFCKLYESTFLWRISNEINRIRFLLPKLNWFKKSWRMLNWLNWKESFLWENWNIRNILFEKREKFCRLNVTETAWCRSLYYKQSVLSEDKCDTQRLFTVFQSINFFLNCTTFFRLWCRINYIEMMWKLIQLWALSRLWWLISDLVRPSLHDTRREPLDCG